jgi:hypothetical protein
MSKRRGSTLQGTSKKGAMVYDIELSNTEIELNKDPVLVEKAIIYGLTTKDKLNNVLKYILHILINDGLTISGVYNKAIFIENILDKILNPREKGNIITWVRNLHPNNMGGGSIPKPSTQRVLINGRNHIIYIGPRGGKYIKQAGRFVTYKHN